MSYVFYVHGSLEKYPAFLQWSNRVYKLWMFKRTMAPCGPDLGASNIPTSSGRVFLCEPVTFSSIFAVLCGLKCFWRARFARSLASRLAKRVLGSCSSDVRFQPFKTIVLPDVASGCAQSTL